MGETRKRGRKAKAPASTTETMDFQYSNATNAAQTDAVIAQNDVFIAANDSVSTEAVNDDGNSWPPARRGRGRPRKSGPGHTEDTEPHAVASLERRPYQNGGVVLEPPPQPVAKWESVAARVVLAMNAVLKVFLCSHGAKLYVAMAKEKGSILEVVVGL